MGESVIKKDIVSVRTLSSGDDLNNLVGVGNTGLYCITTGVSNTPADWTWLLVIGGTGTVQVVFAASWAKIRAYTGSPLAWTSWKVIYGDATVYKNTGSKSVSSAVTISDSWSEADVVIRIGGTSQTFTTHVLRGVNGVYNIGNGPSDKCTASVNISGNTFTVTTVWWYAVDRMSDSTFVVYYR